MDGHRFRPAGPAWVALAIVIVGLVPLTILGVTGYRAAAHALRANTEARLADAASQTSTQVDRLLFERWGDAQAFARNPRARTLDRKTLVPLMQSLKASYAPNYQAMLVAETSGQVVAHVGDVPGAAADGSVAGEPWFDLALAGQETVVGLEQPEGFVVAFSSPIRSADGSIAGVWVNFVSWPAVEGVVRSAVSETRAPTLHAFLLDRNRRVIASDLADGTFAPLAGQQVPVTADGKGVDVRADVLLPGAQGTDVTSSYTSRGYSTYPGLGWTVLTVQERGSALAAAQRLKKQMLGIGAITALLVLVAALAAARAVARAARERERLEETLHRSQKLEAVGRLAGGVAHDFNNLLTVIGGNAQLALEQQVPESVDARLREIAYSTDRAADLVRQLLSFSRVDTVKLRVVEVNDEVEAVLRMLPRLIASNIEIAADLTHEPTLVLADAVQLEQVLLNLGINARDAMPQGGRLTFETSTTESTVRLSVRDTGIGMDDETRSHIFEPFFTTKELGEGTGLGLATAYGIVTRAGGSIEVESTPGLGTTFVIELPFASIDPEQLLTAKGTEVPGGRGERILLAEDDAAVRMVAAEMLQRAGYAVVVASDGDEALRLLGEEVVDLIVCDAMMPRMTGPQLIEAIRAAGDRTPVVLMSGQSQEGATRRGADSLVTTIAKPFTSDELSAAVRRQLGPSRGGGARSEVR
jgi:signal transduction histidine kinase/ActR/RegA family two-component response regulator